MPDNMSPAEARLVNEVQTQHARTIKVSKFVGQVLFPEVPVIKSAGTIVKFGKEEFAKYNLKRAPGSKVARISIGYEGGRYATQQDALEIPIPYEVQRAAEEGPKVDLRQRATEKGMRIITQSLEHEWAALALNPANYDNDHKLSFNPNDMWSAADGDPTADIEHAKAVIQETAMEDANRLVLSPRAWAAVKSNPKIQERFKYTSAQSITLQMLAALWDIEQVVVGKAVTIGADGKPSPIWGKDAVLAYVNPQPSDNEEPSFGYTYVLEGYPLVEEGYTENSHRSWMQPIIHERVPVIAAEGAGCLFQSVAD